MEKQSKQRPRGYWTKETVSQEIMDRKNTGKSLVSTETKKENSSLVYNAIKLYGSWKEALTASGIDHRDWTKRKASIYLTKKDVINGIKERLNNGLSLTASTIQAEDSGLYINANKLFNDWKEALSASGLDYNDWYDREPSGYWTEEKIKEHLIIREDEGKSLTRKDVMTENNKLYNAIMRIYGNWESAAAQIGIGLDSARSQRKWSKDKVKEELLKRKENGMSLRLADIKKEDYYLSLQMSSYFGTSYNAYEAIDEDAARHMVVRETREARKWSKEKVLSELSLRKIQGLTLNSGGVHKEDASLYRNSRKYLGSWKEVLSALETYDADR